MRDSENKSEGTNSEEKQAERGERRGGMEGARHEKSVGVKERVHG